MRRHGHAVMTAAVANVTPPGELTLTILSSGSFGARPFTDDIRYRIRQEILRSFVFVGWLVRWCVR